MTGACSGEAIWVVHYNASSFPHTALGTLAATSRLLVFRTGYSSSSKRSSVGGGKSKVPPFPNRLGERGTVMYLMAQASDWITPVSRPCP